MPPMRITEPSTKHKQSAWKEGGFYQVVYGGQEGITMHGIRLWGAQIGANEHHNHQPDNSEHEKTKQ